MTNAEKLEILRGLVWDAGLDMDEKNELDSYIEELEALESYIHENELEDSAKERRFQRMRDE